MDHGLLWTMTAMSPHTTVMGQESAEFRSDHKRFFLPILFIKTQCFSNNGAMVGIAAPFK